ncbi:methyltransferase domain-containing protein [Cerioporus squamosus]|nr:methyltransferase domain-containing protein [Cerioporus squamosus]
MQGLLDVLSHPLVSSLLSVHPNSLGLSSFMRPAAWETWWNWTHTGLDAKQTKRPSETVADRPWLILLWYYEACRRGYEPGGPCDCAETIPHDVREAIKGLSDLSLPRDVGRSFPPSADSRCLSNSRPSVATISLPGMSPKKAHEVVNMTAFVTKLISSNASLKHTKYAVDIGAGQAYLSRSLRDRLGLHVLALDWSDIQTQGAARKDASKSRRKDQTEQVNAGYPPSHEELNSRGASAGSLTYVTTRIDKESLLASTRAWVEDVRRSGRQSSTEHEAAPTSVLMVALHACGSLTLDILRAFVAAAARGHRTGVSAGQERISWTPQGAVIVGCCYNMMQPEDFPLSRAFRSCGGAEGFCLTANHLQLAAQVPAEWTRTEETVEDARFALRKIVWRAVLEETLQEHGGAESGGAPAPALAPGMQQDRRPRRLGRLNDSAYKDWETFVRTVRRKLELGDVDIPEPNPELERRIGVFQTLRCIAGPAVESLILLDRLAWIQEELEVSCRRYHCASGGRPSGLPYKAELVNLFDQASGSGRNIAIVIRPTE